MKIEQLNDLRYIDKIVEIHLETFDGFFLTFLGRGFLKVLYKGFFQHDKSGIIVAVEDTNAVGFCAFSEDLSGFYKFLMKKHLVEFAWFAFIGFVKKPTAFFRLWRALTYSKESKRDENYIELSSIGVKNEKKNKGIGGQMIDKLIQISDADRFEYIKLETDKENNKSVNSFYREKGFILDHSYQTPEGRNMNEYRYYLGE